MAGQMPPPPPVAAWGPGLPGGRVGGRAGAPAVGGTAQVMGGQRQMQLMMQSAVRVVMKEAGKQLVSDLAAQMREQVQGGMVEAVGSAVATSLAEQEGGLGQMVQGCIREAVVGQINTSLGAMVSEQKELVVQMGVTQGAVARVEGQVMQAREEMSQMQAALQLQAKGLEAFAKDTCERLGGLKLGGEGMQASVAATESAVGTVLQSVGSVMGSQGAGLQQLGVLEQKCEEMRLMLEESVLGMRKAAGDSVSVGSSGGSSSSLVMVVEGEGVSGEGEGVSVVPAKQKRVGGGGQGDDAEVMQEGSGVPYAPGNVSGCVAVGEDGAAKKQKGVAGGGSAATQPS